MIIIEHAVTTNAALLAGSPLPRNVTKPQITNSSSGSSMGDDDDNISGDAPFLAIGINDEITSVLIPSA